MKAEAFAGFLDTIDFDCFGTFTTRKPVSIASCRKIAERTVNFCGTGNYFWAAEPFNSGTRDKYELRYPDSGDSNDQRPIRTRLGYHFHTLMSTDMHKMDIFNWYYERYGRCDIQMNNTPEIRKAASWYLTKYITKDLSDYDFRFSDALKRRKQTNFLSKL